MSCRSSSTIWRWRARSREGLDPCLAAPGQALAAAARQAVRPMEARTAPVLPAQEGWWFEPKWDGFRCLAFRNGKEVILLAKSGKSLTRFFPEVAAMLG